jgi:phenol 2-monooxygenase
MNVSMMDSFNLSWKLAHSLHGLTPRPQTQLHTYDSVLATFASERASVAGQLIEFDSKFSSMFSGQIGVPSPEIERLTHAEFLKVFRDGSGFTSGCGIEYEPGVLVRHADGPNTNPVRRHDPSNGTLTPGRRLLNLRVKRFADSNMRDLQDGKSLLLPFLRAFLLLPLDLALTIHLDMPSTGRYRILVFTSTDLLQPSGRSCTALNNLCGSVISKHPAGTVELVVVHPLQNRFEWTEVPGCVKELAEMKFHGPAKEDVYSIYGISNAEGAIAVVRPDGVVGMVCHLSAWKSVGDFLGCCLIVRS